VESRAPNIGSAKRWVVAVLLATLLASITPCKAQDIAPDRGWSMHGQATFVWQGYGPIRSPYSGANSLPAGGQGRETISATPAIGVLLLPGTEFHFNPEIFQGFGLASTHGLGGFSNGEAQKGGSLEPKAYVARAFFRHTIGLGGEREMVEDGFNQIAGMRDVSRLSLTWGRFAVKDIFDQNSFASDARVDFLNYAVWAAGAFDYAADQKGYGIGAVSEFNQKSWAFRLGFFRQPVHSNAQSLSWDINRQGQVIGELELRYSAMQQPGFLRLLGWGARSNAGSYREALADPAFDPEASIVATRRLRTQYGYALNLEQSLTSVLGFFARWSWRDAKADVMSWTDIDSSMTAGVVVKGQLWGRRQDAWGIAFASNWLSRDHRDYTAAGGLGVTIGDGRLNYSGERVFETYYAIGLAANATLAFDYQLVSNPAYNSDRGPVSLFAVRLRGSY
jgi:high affinity Mn2+ porin